MICTMCGNRIWFWQDCIGETGKQEFNYHSGCLLIFLAEYVTREITQTGGLLLGDKVEGWEPRPTQEPAQ